MKKLIPALCMLLVAACLMGTSTYAWFAANTQVTASGMEVKALSSGGLAIGSYNDNGTKVTQPEEADFASNAVWTTGDYVRGAAAIKPASYNNDFDGQKWFKATAATANSHAAATGIDEIAAADLDQYRKEFWWDVKSLKDGYVVDVLVTEVSVAVKPAEGQTTATATSATLDKSIRVAIVTDEASFIFAPLHNKTLGEGESALQYVGSMTTTTDETTGTVTKSFVPATANLLRANNAYNGVAKIFTALGVTAEKVSVYIYYEGEDPNCKSANATNIDDLVVTFKFEATDERVAPTQG